MVRARRGRAVSALRAQLPAIQELEGFGSGIGQEDRLRQGGLDDERRPRVPEELGLLWRELRRQVVEFLQVVPHSAVDDS